MEFWIFIGIVLVIWWVVRASIRGLSKNRNAVPRLHDDFPRLKRDQFSYDNGPSDDRIAYTIETRFARDYRPKRMQGRPARWLARDETTEIAGLSVKGGLVYVGENLPAQSGYENENCLINPKWKVASGRTDHVTGLSYWPAYHSITPSQRRTYLHWLAGERDDPEIDIGYVFLYFYGLERRLFLDQATSEAEVLIAEVERLYNIYGDNRSFHSYAQTFLSSAGFVSGRFPSAPTLSPEKTSFELPPVLRAAIGIKLHNGEKLTWDWLLAWYLGHPDTYLRTPATRCFEEFKALFEKRFRERYPDGLAVRSPKKTLRPTYRAASGTFTVTLENGLGNIPDPVDLKVPMKVAGEIAEQITADLDSYSRYLGRNPGAEETLAAQLLLPAELSPTPGSALGGFRTFLENRLSGSTTLIPLQELLETLQIDDGREKPAANSLKTLSKALAICDVGMEPDRAFGAQAIDREMIVVLFRAAGGGRVDANRANFAAARILVELAAMAIAADGVADESEVAVVVEHIKRLDDLLAMERVCLLALLSALGHSSPNQQALLRRLGKADEVVRDGAAQIVLSIIAADGRLDADEIKFAEKLFKTLKLPVSRLYADLHGLGADTRRDEPVIVAKAGSPKGHPIPEPPRDSGRSTTIRLDPALVAAKRQETAKVSALLATVFAEEEQRDFSGGLATSDTQQIHRYGGLDAEHASLVDAMVENCEIARSDFETLCRKGGLFPAGAIETINDWAFETFDDALIEDGDPISIDPELIAPLMERVEAAL